MAVMGEAEVQVAAVEEGWEMEAAAMAAQAEADEMAGS